MRMTKRRVSKICKCKDCYHAEYCSLMDENYSNDGFCEHFKKFVSAEDYFLALDLEYEQMKEDYNQDLLRGEKDNE